MILQKDVVIGKMPIMLRSLSCVLYGKDEDELAKLGSYTIDKNKLCIVLYLHAFEFMLSTYHITNMLTNFCSCFY